LEIPGYYSKGVAVLPSQVQEYEKEARAR
jgi:hypothetical protein